MGDSGHNSFDQVLDGAKLDELFSKSNQGPVVIFKHSNTCPISSGVYQIMQGVSIPVSIVVVQQARAISNEIEKRTGVRHESPQVIILRNGQAVWTASHWDIDSRDVEAAVRSNA
jgi:bacillithiol system protein YtxJ